MNKTTDKQIEALNLALEALKKCDSALAEELAAWDIDPPLHHVQEASNACGPAITAIREALAEHIPDANKMVEQPKLSDYEPDGMHHNKLQQRPQNCGTGYCSCIECPYEQPAQQQGWKLVPVQPTDEMRDAGNAIIGDRGALFAAYRAMLNAAPQPAQQEPVITKNEKGLTLHVGWDDLPAGTKLYTSPQPSKPLTDEQIIDQFKTKVDTGSLLSFADGVRFAEAAHGIGEKK